MNSGVIIADEEELSMSRGATDEGKGLLLRIALELIVIDEEFCVCVLRLWMGKLRDKKRCDEIQIDILHLNF